MRCWPKLMRPDPPCASKGLVVWLTGLSSAGKTTIAERLATALPEQLLERTHELAALDDALAAVRATGRGRLVLVSGEAGIGKTALVQTFCAGGRNARVLSGACEALHTPRPLGPLADIAAETGGELAGLLERRAAPGDVLAGLMNASMVPMWVLSGVFFSSENFPQAAQPFIKALPLTPLIDALRAVMLEGESLGGQWHRLAILAAWGVGSFALALRWFRWN